MKLSIKILLFIAVTFLSIKIFFPSPAPLPSPEVSQPKHVAQVVQPTPSKVFEVIAVSSKFSRFEKQLIREATSNWEFYTDGLATFKVTSDDPLANPIIPEPGQKVQIIFISPTNSYDPKTQIIDALIGGTSIGYYDPNTLLAPTIWLVQDRIEDEEEYLSVTMHELGHSIGLEHTSHPSTLMYPTVDESIMCVTQYDLKGFCKIYGCDTEEMNFCYPRTEGPACLSEESLQPSQIFSFP